MVTAADMRQHFTAVLNAHTQEGIDLFRSAHGIVPVLSHACFKFHEIAAYQHYCIVAAELGTVTTEEFGGKEIAWCRLHEPWKSGALQLEWLELVEPRLEPHLCDAITSLGYAVSALPQVIKLLSRDESIVFRYQAKHARELAGMS